MSLIHSFGPQNDIECVQYRESDSVVSWQEKVSWFGEQGKFCQERKMRLGGKREYP